MSNSLLVLKSNYDVLMVGDEQIGKTSLIYRFVSNEYVVDLPSVEELYLKMVVDEQGRYHEFTILDSSSTVDHYSSSRKQQILNANIVICAYSIDSLSSFHNTVDNIDIIKSIRPDIKFYLLGTKMDLDDVRQVTYNQGLELAQKIDSLGFWECSAKNGINIDEAFQPVIDYLFEMKKKESSQFLEKIKEEQIEVSNNTNLLISNDDNDTVDKDDEITVPKKSLQSKRSLQSKPAKVEPEKSGCCTIV